LWRRDRTPRACVKQHRTHKGRSEFFASVSQQLLTTQTELLIGTRRAVPISSALHAVFQAQQTRCKSTGACDLVFATHKGTPLSPKNLRNRVLEPTRKALGLPHLSWHTFRYTHATWLSEAQVPARIAQSILGHSDVSMTLNVYTQVVPESQRAALEKIGAILDPNGPKFERNQNSDSARVN
jgi:integrase